MRALYIDKDGLRLIERPTPEPKNSEEVRVDVRLAGICGTDLGIVNGYKGFVGVLGHEFVGTLETGERVVGEINVGCGACARCAADGNGHHCPSRKVLGIIGLDGCFAESFVLPRRNLHIVPEHVPDEVAVFTEPVAACYRVVELIAPVDHPVAVVGDGRLGLLQAMVLHAEGFEVVLYGRHPQKMDIVASLGVSTRPADGFEARYQTVVDVTGSPTGTADALSRVAPRGTLVIKSTTPVSGHLDTTRIVVDELRVVGSRCGPIRRALDALADGAIDPTPLISGRFGLADGVEAFARAGERGVLKVLLSMRPPLPLQRERGRSGAKRSAG